MNFQMLVNFFFKLEKNFQISCNQNIDLNSLKNFEKIMKFESFLKDFNSKLRKILSEEFGFKYNNFRKNFKRKFNTNHNLNKDLMKMNFNQSLSIKEDENRINQQENNEDNQPIKQDFFHNMLNNQNKNINLDISIKNESINESLNTLTESHDFDNSSINSKNFNKNIFKFENNFKSEITKMNSIKLEGNNFSDNSLNALIKNFSERRKSKFQIEGKVKFKFDELKERRKTVIIPSSLNFNLSKSKNDDTIEEKSEFNHKKLEKNLIYQELEREKLKFLFKCFETFFCFGKDKKIDNCLDRFGMIRTFKEKRKMQNFFNIGEFDEEEENFQKTFMKINFREISFYENLFIYHSNINQNLNKTFLLNQIIPKIRIDFNIFYVEDLLDQIGIIDCLILTLFGVLKMNLSIKILEFLILKNKQNLTKDVIKENIDKFYKINNTIKLGFLCNIVDIVCLKIKQKVFDKKIDIDKISFEELKKRKIFSLVVQINSLSKIAIDFQKCFKEEIKIKERKILLLNYIKKIDKEFNLLEILILVKFHLFEFIKLRNIEEKIMENDYHAFRVFLELRYYIFEYYDKIYLSSSDKIYKTHSHKQVRDNKIKIFANKLFMKSMHNKQNINEFEKKYFNNNIFCLNGNEIPMLNIENKDIINLKFLKDSNSSIKKENYLKKKHQNIFLYNNEQDLNKSKEYTTETINTHIISTNYKNSKENKNFNSFKYIENKNYDSSSPEMKNFNTLSKIKNSSINKNTKYKNFLSDENLNHDENIRIKRNDLDNLKDLIKSKNFSHNKGKSLKNKFFDLNNTKKTAEYLKINFDIFNNNRNKNLCEKSINKNLNVINKKNIEFSFVKKDIKKFIPQKKYQLFKDNSKNNLQFSPNLKINNKINNFDNFYQISEKNSCFSEKENNFYEEKKRLIQLDDLKIMKNKKSFFNFKNLQKDFIKKRFRIKDLDKNFFSDKE